MLITLADELDTSVSVLLGETVMESMTDDLIKETYTVTAPAEYKGLLFVLQTQRSAEEYENGIVNGLGTDEAHTFDGTINDGSVAIELDRDYDYVNVD